MISNKDENDIKNFIDELLEELEKVKIQKINEIKNIPIKEEYKVCFIGSSKTGAKTSLVKLINGKKINFNEYIKSSAKFSKKMIKLNNKKFCLHLWELSGEENEKLLVKLYIQKCDCIVIGFDVTNYYSFQSVRDFYNFAKENSSAKFFI